MWDGQFAGMVGGWGGWAWPFMGIVPLLFLALLIAAVVLLVRSASGGGNLPPSERRSPGLDALEERYARGEINREEYLQKKKDILG